MDLNNKKITLVGLGRTSLALAELLMAKGAQPIITELKTREACGSLAVEAANLDVEIEFGGHSTSTFENADLIVPSPGVPPDNAPIAQAAKQGIPVMGELELASRFCTARIIAVTGTNGKTTTTTLIHAMLTACGHDAVLAGNNDIPFSTVVLQEKQPEYIVLEVSSYQLETVSTFKPWIGVVLNLTNDHLARHKTMETYAVVKARIFARQSQGDTAIINKDDSWVREMSVPKTTRRLGFSIEGPAAIEVKGDSIYIEEKQAAALTDITLKGRHNLQNVLAALAVMHAGGFDWDGVLKGLREFQGVAHRIEFVDTINGVAYYNDSKATNLDSLKVALESFDTPVVLIAGGEGKGSEYTSLNEVIKVRAGGIVVFGADAGKMKEAWGSLTPTIKVDTMQQAVTTAFEMADKHTIKTVLLSPACASFDHYKNFEERGMDFKACVASLKPSHTELHPTS